MEKEIRLMDQKIALLGTSFERKEPFRGNLKIVSKDLVENLVVNDSGISFIFIRKVSLDPNMLFDVSVSFLYEAKFDSKCIEILKEKQFKLVKKEIEQIINNTTIVSNSSMIISFLTSFNGNNPLVTSPICKLSEEPK